MLLAYLHSYLAFLKVEVLTSPSCTWCTLAFSIQSDFFCYSYVYKVEEIIKWKVQSPFLGSIQQVFRWIWPQFSTHAAFVFHLLGGVTTGVGNWTGEREDRTRINTDVFAFIDSKKKWKWKSKSKSYLFQNVAYEQSGFWE